jgi:hypothetical protein
MIVTQPVPRAFIALFSSPDEWLAVRHGSLSAVTSGEAGFIGDAGARLSELPSHVTERS